MDVRQRIKEIGTDRKKQAVRVHGLLVNAVYAAGGLLTGISVFPFGASPLGFALLCSADRYAAAVFAGLCLSLIGKAEPWVFLGAYAMTLALRALFTVTTEPYVEGGREEQSIGGFIERLFGEHVSLRIISASVGAFIVGLYRMFVGGFLYYDLFGAILSIGVAALGTFLWYFLPSERALNTKKEVGRVLRTLGGGSLVAALVYGLRGVSFYGVLVSPFICMLAVLWSTRKYGVTFGAGLAIITGALYSLAYAPLFVFAAICYGLLLPLSPLIASLASFAVGMGWGIYINGAASLAALLPALLASNFIFYAFNKLYLSEPDDTEEASADASAERQESGARRLEGIAASRLDDAAKRIKALCEGLASLSETLLYTEERRAEENIPFRCCREAIEGGNLELEIGEMGKEDTVDGLLDGIETVGAYMSDSVRAETVALDYRAISDYLADIMIANDREYGADEIRGRRLQDKLSETFPDVSCRAEVFGTERQRVIIGSDSRRFLIKNREKLRRLAIDACELSLDNGELLEIGDSTYLSFYRSALLDAVFAGRKRNALDEKTYCGDSFGVIRTGDDGKLFTFISDGMGSGREAAVTSGLCTLFLQKLLPINVSGGDSVGATLQLLNSFLRSRNSAGERESLATVDLGVLDLVGCRAGFYKSGAAPTYVFRDGALFKLRARTMPIGIVKAIDTGRVDMELLPGDVIIMVSDGVTEGREECPELFELLRSRLLTHSAEELADAVIGYADERGCRDDVSVVVVKITERQEIMQAAS